MPAPRRHRQKKPNRRLRRKPKISRQVRRLERRLGTGRRGPPTRTWSYGRQYVRQFPCNGARIFTGTTVRLRRLGWTVAAKVGSCDAHALPPWRDSGAGRRAVGLEAAMCAQRDLGTVLAVARRLEKVR